MASTTRSSPALFVFVGYFSDMICDIATIGLVDQRLSGTLLNDDKVN